MNNKIEEYETKQKQFSEKKLRTHSRQFLATKMVKKIITLTFTFFVICSSLSQVSVVATMPGEVQAGNISLEYRNVTMYAPAVAQTENGHVGVISTITVTVQNNGNGRVFVDTLPLTQIDMQGSARLAVKVASALVESDKSCNVNTNDYDFFFVIRTSSPVIGGPSAGAVMTLATIAVLENWTIDDKTVMTGMIDPDGSIGPIGGIPQKIDAAHSVGATRFLIPKGQMEYTEMVTESTGSNGWWQTTTHPVTRNVSDYAMEHYGMKVFEVADINDALLYTTGHYFPVPEADNQITTEDYINTMKPLATELLTNADELYSNASESLDNSKIPNRWPYYYKNQVTDHINYAEDYLNSAREQYQNDSYYSSTSRSFQSLINSRFVIYACDYFDSNDGQGYVQTLINNTQLSYSVESKQAENEEINGMISLQCVGAAQKRAVEASKYLKDANASYSNGNYLDALYQIAFATERSKSVGWWINLTSQFEEAGEIDNITLTALAEDYIENAQQSIAYSTVLLQEMGKNPSYLASAEELLSDAHDDKENGYPAAALFEALEALVRGNLALELVDGVTEDKINRARESAEVSISESRGQGIEPVLSVSYYELAESLINESSYENAMFQYKYSDLIAGVVGLTGSSGGHSSRYVGIPEQSYPSSEMGFLANASESFIIYSIIGCIIGLIIGIIVCNIHRKTRKQIPIDEDYWSVK